MVPDGSDALRAAQCGADVTVVERRASAILYRILQAAPVDRPMLVPVNVCDAVGATFLAANRPFELVDVSPAGFGMDKAACAARISRGAVGGVVYVHPYGALDAEVPRFFADLRALRPGLILIDDRCLCAPQADGELTPQADATLYSTGYGKVLDLDGGGFAYVENGLGYAPVDAPEKDGWLDLRPPSTTWPCYRDRILAELPGMRAHKAALNAIYRSALADVALPVGYDDWRFNIRVAEPERLIRTLFAAGLFASRHYRPLLREGAFPVCEGLYASIVNLFNDRHYDHALARRTVEIVRRHVDGVSGG